MNAAAEKIRALSQIEIQSLLAGSILSIDLEGRGTAIRGTADRGTADRSLDLTLDEVEIERVEKEGLKVLNEGSLTVALDTRLTEELKQEGMVRDMVRYIQNLRKEKGLNVTDRINLYLHGSDTLLQAVEKFKDHLTSETLTLSWSWKKVGSAREMRCGEENCYVSLSRIGDASESG